MKFSLFRVTDKAEEIKSDEYRRRKSVYFAVTSIIYSVLMFLSLWGGIFLLSWADQSLLIIFIIVLGLGLLGMALTCLVNAVIRLIVQFVINRGVMSWIALAVLIASTAVGVFMAFNTL